MDKDSIDVTIKSNGKLSEQGKFYSPSVEIQLKATINWNVNDDNKIPFSLKIKNYNDLRVERVTPAILVVLCLPREKGNWYNHTTDECVLRKCAYWMSLRGLPAVTTDSKTVYIPIENVFSPSAIRNILTRIGEEGAL